MSERTEKSPPEEFSRGRQLRHQGDLDGAIACFREAIAKRTDFIPAYNNLANALQTRGDQEEAGQVFQTALGLAPTLPVLHCNYASHQLLCGRHAEAVQSYERALALDPTLAMAHHNLAKAFAVLRDFNLALRSYQTALRLKPDDANIHYDCGNLYQQYGDLQLAMEFYKAALRLDRKHAEAWASLGAVLQTLGEHAKSGKCYRRALSIKPDFDLAHSYLAQLLETTSTLTEARAHYEAALQLKPSNTKLRFYYAFLLQKQADWQRYDEMLGQLEVAALEHLQEKEVEGLPAMIALSFPLPQSLRKQLAMQLAQQHQRTAAFIRGSASSSPDPVSSKRLRIGYVSPDFRLHAVGSLVAPLFALHDRSRYEIHAYSLVPSDDDVAAAIRAGVDHFMDMSTQSTLDIAKRIEADGIHVLVDLAGYTAHSCTSLFALRPAPVQVQYLGYPGTMGADYLPHMLADKHLVPAEQQVHYSENIHYLPTAWATAPPAISDRVFTRKECGLPATATVFCCHNGTYKIDPTVFRIWMAILQKVPHSVLWLIADETADIEARLREQAVRHNIDPARLVFAQRLPPAEYLARYRLADLFLDTFVYNAGATAVGALAAGLPLLTCPGDHYAARMGASLCAAVGLEELICRTPADYQARAIALGNDRAQLLALKQKLLASLPTAPLFQPGPHVRNLEQAFSCLWDQHLRNIRD